MNSFKYVYIYIYCVLLYITRSSDGSIHDDGMGDTLIPPYVRKCPNERPAAALNKTGKAHATTQNITICTYIYIYMCVCVQRCDYKGVVKSVYIYIYR